MRPHRLAVLLTGAALVVLTALSAAATACAGARGPVDARGVFVRAAGQDAARFVPWTGNLRLQAELNKLVADGGGELRFAPGDYELELGLVLQQARGVTLAGMPGARLHFAPEPARRPALTARVEKGATSLTVDDASSMRPGMAYQVYPASLKGDRILEFRAARIEGDVVQLTRPAHYMGHVEDIPAGAVVVEEVNLVRVMESDDIVVEGLVLDGLGRGDVHGHTTYCGVYAVGVYRPGEPPTSRGLTVRGCTLKGFQGRGVCVYATRDVLIEGCAIAGVDSQAVELDHFSTGRVVGNAIAEAGVGVALNDAFDSVVAANVITGCGAGVAFVKHFPQPMFNRGNVVEDNLFVACPRAGVELQAGIAGNTLRRNRFAGMPQDRWVRGAGSGNVVEASAQHE